MAAQPKQLRLSLSRQMSFLPQYMDADHQAIT